MFDGSVPYIVTTSYLLYLTYLFLQMSSTEESNNSDNSSDGPPIFNLAATAVALARYKAAVAKAAPVVNPEVPLPKVTGR